MDIAQTLPLIAAQVMGAPVGIASDAVAQQLEPEGGWTADGLAWWHPLIGVGPWILAALVVGGLAWAFARRRRYNALGVLDEAAQQRVHEAIREAELHTVGEVVPVVVERSDAHPAAAWVAAFWGLLLGSTLLVGVLPWNEPMQLLGCQLGLGMLGFLAARALPGIARLFVSEQRATDVCEEQAIVEFHRLGLRDTDAATGVLVFVSLFEHRVVVLGDAGINAVLPPEHWDQVTEAALAGIVAGDLARGLVDAVTACGHPLAEHFPWADGDRNELPDRLEIRRQ